MLSGGVAARVAALAVWAEHQLGRLQLPYRRTAETEVRVGADCL
jgi:hypothetical protein